MQDCRFAGLATGQKIGVLQGSASLLGVATPLLLLANYLLKHGCQKRLAAACSLTKIARG